MQQSPSFSSRRGAAALARQPARVVVPVEIAKGRDRRLVAHGKSESDVGYLFLGALVSAVRPDLLSAGGTVELDARIKLKHLYPAKIVAREKAEAEARELASGLEAKVRCLVGSNII